MKVSAVSARRRTTGLVSGFVSASLLSFVFLSGAIAAPESADYGKTQGDYNKLGNAQTTSAIESVPVSGSVRGLSFYRSNLADQIVLDPKEYTSLGNLDYKVTRLNNPERLVVDIFGSNKATSANADIGEALFVQKVRVGAHPDKTRLVFDLKNVQELSHDVSMRGSDLVVTVAKSWDMQNALNQAANQKAVAAAAAAPLVANNRAASGQARITDNEFANAPADELGKRVLSEIKIEQSDDEGNSVVADLTAPGFYSLKKTAPSEYVLRLEGAGLSPDATSAVVAPSGSGQIRSARPTVDGNDVLVRIFADPHSILTAKTNAGKVIVSASNGLLDDTRAQLAPEKAAAEEASPKADAPKTDTAASPQADAGEADVVLTAGEEDEISAILNDAPKYSGRLISLDLQDTDIDNALRIIAEVSNLNIIASDDVTGKVTLRLIDVPWDQALDVILKTNGLDKVQEGNVIRIAPVEKLRTERESLKQAQQAEEELEPLAVKYIRVSYAKASDLKPLVESVLSERGAVSYDERTNQIIVKDIRKGLRNVAELVTKLDLRTPQVLLETQIVEAQRSLLRDLGTELGFEYIQSPQTGNATNHNFPNSVLVGQGNITGAAPNVVSSFPAAVDASGGSAISFLFGSADGTRSLDARISALENEGRVKIISRPAVATTNNKQATIKSVEKIRVKTPSGGVSVATGQGAAASGSSTTATETIEVGITLSVTPQASPDYFVLLDIDAKSSTFGARVVEGIPSEVERKATSTVLVSSGQTFAMGGIYKIEDRDELGGVPFLKDIPVLGHLFRRLKIDNKDEELIFFITPRIIEGSFDDAAMKSAS